MEVSHVRSGANRRFQWVSRLVSCAGSASVWAPELMVSRFLYPPRAECCMFRPSCRLSDCGCIAASYDASRWSWLCSRTADAASLLMVRESGSLFVASKKLYWASRPARVLGLRFRVFSARTQMHAACKQSKLSPSWSLAFPPRNSRPSSMLCPNLLFPTLKVTMLA